VSFATLSGFLGDFDLAEEAAQEACPSRPAQPGEGVSALRVLGSPSTIAATQGQGHTSLPICPAIVVVIVAAFGGCTEPPCPSRPVCLIGLGGPDLEIAVGGLQNI
jgi:hypothetical protein